MLGVPAFVPGQFDLTAKAGSGTENTVFWTEDVVDIMLLHPAEGAEMERDCICDEDDLMSWMRCPLHRFEGQ
jgi:hypothetical protein